MFQCYVHTADLAKVSAAADKKCFDELVRLLGPVNNHDRIKPPSPKRKVEAHDLAERSVSPGAIAQQILIGP